MSTFLTPVSLRKVTG